MKMHSLSSVGLLFVVMVPFLAMACGSEVTSSGSTSGSSSSSSSSSGGGDAAQNCADVCHKLETLNCTLGNDCNTECAGQIASYATECSNDVSAYFACLLQYTNSCDFPTACNSLETALDTCQAQFGCTSDSTCFGGAGMNGEMSCGCEETCKGTKYSTNCTTPAGATMTTCDCLVNDMSMGTCSQTNSDACGAQDSCCNATYFKF